MTAFLVSFYFRMIQVSSYQPKYKVIALCKLIQQNLFTEELSDNKAKLAADKALTEHLQSQLATLEDRLREYQMISETPKLYDDIYDDNTPTLVRKKKVMVPTLINDSILYWLSSKTDAVYDLLNLMDRKCFKKFSNNS